MSMKPTEASDVAKTNTIVCSLRMCCSHRPGRLVRRVIGRRPARSTRVENHGCEIIVWMCSRAPACVCTVDASIRRSVRMRTLGLMVVPLSGSAAQEPSHGFGSHAHRGRGMPNSLWLPVRCLPTTLGVWCASPSSRIHVHAQVHNNPNMLVRIHIVVSILVPLETGNDTPIDCAGTASV